MTPVNRSDWQGFPPGTVRMEKPRDGDIRKLPDGTYDITVRFTRSATMTPEERAKLLQDQWCTENPSIEVIAAAIRAAVAEERERCARIIDRCACQYKDETPYSYIYAIARRIRELK